MMGSGNLLASLFGSGDTALALAALIVVISSALYSDRKTAALKKLLYEELGNVYKKGTAYCNQEMRHEKELREKDIGNIQGQITTGFQSLEKLIETLRKEMEAWRPLKT